MKARSIYCAHGNIPDACTRCHGPDLVPTKALTLHGLWAWAVVNGFKFREFRSWDTKFRGRFAVHAGSNLSHMVEVNARLEALGIETPDMVDVSAIVGYATIESVSKQTGGGFAFELSDVVKLPKPVDCSGFVQLWEIPAPIRRKLECR